MTAKRGPGRPEIGKRRQVVLDDESAAILIALGAGNLSAGIRAAAAIIAKEKPQPPKQPGRTAPKRGEETPELR